jgi:hypothetical protein
MHAIDPPMTSFQRWSRVSWLCLHLLLIALICGHETAWLIGKQLTVVRPDSGPWWKEVDHVSQSLTRGRLLPENAFGKVINTYTNLAGIEVGYGYFAPNVPEAHALVFELCYPDKHLEYEAPLTRSHEGKLRLTSLIEQIGSTDSDPWRNELIRRLARSTWQNHPKAISMRGFFGTITPPTLGSYKSGRNERVFSCQYIYDFSVTLRDEGGSQ